jgi:hypothetical protein
MAEPWVPKSELTTEQALMTELEVFTDAAEVYTDLIAANVALALTNRNIVVNAAQGTFNPLLLGSG